MDVDEHWLCCDARTASHVFQNFGPADGTLRTEIGSVRLKLSGVFLKLMDCFSLHIYELRVFN